jgi:uncharacterized membrane protein YkvA (DUF1232 family)
MTKKLLNAWKRRTSQLTTEARCIYLAYKDPRVPWYAKILIVCVIGYAFSPLDKVLDSIPIIGYLDHLIFIPLGCVLAFKKTIPSQVFTDCQKIAMNQLNPSRMDRFIIVFIGCLLVSLVIVSAIGVMKDWNLVLAQWFRWFTRMTFTSGSNAREPRGHLIALARLNIV